MATLHELAADIGALMEAKEAHEKRIAKLEAENGELKSMVNRWKGGAAVLIVFGSIVGWIATHFEALRALGFK